MTDTITRLRELRADWRAKAQACLDELRAVVAQGPAASRASLDGYRGEMSEALEYYQAYLFKHADALIAIAEAAAVVAESPGYDTEQSVAALDRLDEALAALSNHQPPAQAEKE